MIVTRLSASLAAAAVVVLPVLSGCGAGSSGSAEPMASSAPASSAAAAPSTSATDSAAATPSAASPSPTTDPAAEKKAAADASEKFLEAVLTIGYPDEDVDEYAGRVKPLMTKTGYAALLQGDSRRSASSAVKKLTSQRARTVPKIEGDPKVSDLSADAATVRITYRNQAQLRDGGGWKVLKTSGKETATITLVKDGEKWLAEDAR